MDDVANSTQRQPRRIDIEGRIVACKIRILRAARNFAKAMAEFEGDLQFCGEIMNEVVDAADRLMELEAVQDAE